MGNAGREVMLDIVPYISSTPAIVVSCVLCGLVHRLVQWRCLDALKEDEPPPSFGEKHIQREMFQNIDFVPPC